MHSRMAEFLGTGQGYAKVMRIAVTGATGNIGTALLRRYLGTAGPEILGLARRRPGRFGVMTGLNGAL